MTRKHGRTPSQPGDEQALLRRARRGRTWVALVFDVLLLVAWYPFLAEGVRLVQQGRFWPGTLLALLPAGFCLLTAIEVRRSQARFLQDIQRGRWRRVMPDAGELARMDADIDAMPISGNNLSQKQARELLKAGARMGGYEHPNRGVRVRRYLLVVLLGSLAMYLVHWGF